ncbi:MAG: L-lactate dehydrogenase [Candidatus Omnitrophota bacterium]|jgi:L-lactate dehydrogenase
MSQIDQLRPKISIIGCGGVGMRYAYALIMKGLARQLVLVDKDKNRLEGEVMDLSHGAPYISPVEIIAGEYSDLAGSDLVVITAGRKQQPGESRIDLVSANVGLYKAIIPEVVKYAPDAIILVVSNPVDILSYAAFKFSGKPAHEVIGSGTVLDTARFRFLLSRHCNIDPHNVHAYILGEHGDSEIAVWSKAMIGGVYFSDYCLICEKRRACRGEKEFDEILSEVRNSAYKIIEKKGETSYGIGLALVRITRAIINNENAVLPVSTLIQDYLGVGDVYLSVPSILNRAGVRAVLRLELNSKEREEFKKSAETVKSVIKQAGL